MDQKKHPLISAKDVLKDELVGCGHQLQQINALLDILWRAAYHDANHGGYPEVVQLARKQVSAVSDHLIALASQLSVERSAKADLPAEKSSQAAQTSDVRLQPVDRPVQADLDKAS